MIKEVHTIQGSFEDYILLAKDYDLTQMPDIRFIPLFGANGVGEDNALKSIEWTSYQAVFKAKSKRGRYSLDKAHGLLCIYRFDR